MWRGRPRRVVSAASLDGRLQVVSALRRGRHRRVVSAALLNGPRVDRWHWRCGVGGPSPPPRACCAAILFGRAVAEEESALMAPVSTGGVGSGVARLPTRQVVDGPSFDGMCRPSCSMAHALTGGIGISARAVPRPPPCARCPPGAAIVDEWSCFFLIYSPLPPLY